MHEASRYPRPFGKYLLLRQLATGGMAEVYLARANGPAGFEKECVIKRILPQLATDQQFVQMFLDEARIAARLSHPNIVQIYDLGQVGDKDFYIAMEYVHGIDLEQLLDAERARGGRVPTAIACRILSNVAEGLDHAHRAVDGRGQPLGLVHRDVSASNVMVSFDGVAKVLDFGIAKAAPRQGRTEVGVIKGKIPYMSPEQVEGQPLDARSDIFSLGTMLYELVVGEKPFDGQSPAEVSLQILKREPSLGPLMASGHPDALGRILKRAHAKQRSERYASARDLQIALETFLAASRMACTSHDVAAYLEELFPGLRERTEADAHVPPPAATDPTVPQMVAPTRTPSVRGALGDEPDGPPVLGDLSSTQLGNFEDVRRNLGGGGGRGVTFVVVGLVAAVALGFWLLSRHSTETPAVAAPVTTTPAATTTTPAAPAAAPQKPAVKPAVVAEKPAAKPQTVAAPAPEKPAAAAEKPAPAAPVAAPAKPKPAHHAPPKHHAKPAAEQPLRELPRLPQPPPTDDSN